jgi:hypothetical protein
MANTFAPNEGQGQAVPQLPAKRSRTMQGLGLAPAFSWDYYFRLSGFRIMVRAEMTP